MICQSNAGLLAAFGVGAADVVDLRIGVISTGDEIAPVGTNPLPYGRIRDANTYIIASLASKYGFPVKSYGVSKDSWPELKCASDAALSECDAVLLSGGSSVGARDHTARLVSSLSSPGLVVRGINMAPGKPTVIGGSAGEKKLMAGLPGHPLSCAVALIFVVLPLLASLIGSREPRIGKCLRVPLDADVPGRTGLDEFIPAAVSGGTARPLAAKSGYVSALSGADGFIRLRPDTETLRRGEAVEIWMW
jgi:molybdopterin molybdotransferase